MENAVPAKSDERRETPPIIQKEIETLSNRKIDCPCSHKIVHLLVLYAMANNK